MATLHDVVHMDSETRVFAKRSFRSLVRARWKSCCRILELSASGKDFKRRGIVVMSKHGKKKSSKKKGRFHGNSGPSKRPEKKLNPFEVRYQTIKKSKSIAAVNKIVQQKKARNERVSKVSPSTRIFP